MPSLRTGRQTGFGSPHYFHVVPLFLHPARRAVRMRDVVGAVPSCRAPMPRPTPLLAPAAADVAAEAPLLPRIALGDELAVREFLRRYGGLVLALSQRMSSSESDAEDACQEIFLDLWKVAGTFDPARGREVTFVAMIARRRLVDRYRAARNASPRDTARDLVLRPERVEAHADAQVAMAALGELAEWHQQTIILAACYGLSHGEIATELRMPLGTVKSAIRRGLERLKHALSHGLIPEEPTP